MITAFDMLCGNLFNESHNMVHLCGYNCNVMEENVLADSCGSFDLHNLLDHRLVTGQE